MDAVNKTKLDNCLNLIKRLPYSRLTQNTDSLSKLIRNKDLQTEFNNKITKILEVSVDDSLGPFIKCENNRLGTSYRSPWSNKFFPSVAEPSYPPNELRELEIKFNKLFSIYAKFYYAPSAVSSVYIWDLGESMEHGFGAALLVKNEISNTKYIKKGVWDSYNYVTVKFMKEIEKEVVKIKASYKLTTTVIFSITSSNNEGEEKVASGSFTRNGEESYYIKSYIDDDFHIEKIGKLVENMENNLRNQIDEVYIKKSKEIVGTARYSKKIGKDLVANAALFKEMFLNEMPANVGEDRR